MSCLNCGKALRKNAKYAYCTTLETGCRKLYSAQAEQNRGPRKPPRLPCLMRCGNSVNQASLYQVCQNTPDCRREYNRLYYTDNPPDSDRAKFNSRRYYVRVKEAKAIRLQSQGGTCAWPICAKPLAIDEAHTDHNHRIDASKRRYRTDGLSVRGEVHGYCNTGQIAHADMFLELGAVFPEALHAYLTNDRLEYVFPGALWDKDSESWSSGE